MKMKDWRGNTYEEEKIEGKKCVICKKQAVKNCCKAERDIDRTHHHGAIHTRDRGLCYLCRSCANKENKNLK